MTMMHVLVFNCEISYYLKQNYHLTVSVDQKPGHSLALFSAQALKGWNWTVGWNCDLFWASESCSSKLIKVVGLMKFLWFRTVFFLAVVRAHCQIWRPCSGPNVLAFSHHDILLLQRQQMNPYIVLLQ